MAFVVKRLKDKSQHETPFSEELLALNRIIVFSFCTKLCLHSDHICLNCAVLQVSLVAIVPSDNEK